MQAPQPPELGAELPTPSLMVASQAYRLSSALMGILMRSRVVNEEPLTLAGTEIVAQGKRSDTQNLLCCGASPEPGCHFSIPTAFSGALANLSDVVQLILLVDSNPFPFGFIGNYTVSTKVASMAFQTQAGTHIPIGHLASERAIVVKVPSTSDQAAFDQHSSATSTIVPPGTSVSAMVVPESSNPEAGLHLRLTYELLNGRAGQNRAAAGQSGGLLAMHQPDPACVSQSTSCLRSQNPTWPRTFTQRLGPMSTTVRLTGESALGRCRARTTGLTPSSWRPGECGGPMGALQWVWVVSGLM